MALGAERVLVGGGLSGKGWGVDLGMSWEAESTAGSPRTKVDGSLLKWQEGGHISSLAGR